MRETQQREMPLLLVLVPRQAVTCFLLVLVLLLTLRPAPEQQSKQHSTKHGALLLAGRGFGRPVRALICSYNGGYNCCILESYSSAFGELFKWKGGWQSLFKMGCPQPSPPCYSEE